MESITIDKAEGRVRRLRRVVLTHSRLLTEQCASSGFRFKAAMVTLTYAPEHSWDANDIRDCLQRVRMWLKRRGHALRYCWVQELTQAGRPHYHVLIWLPRGLSLPKPDKQGWWSKGSTRIEWARKAVGYLAKYASKGATASLQDAIARPTFPKGCRICGGGGLEGEHRLQRAWWLLPRYVREQFEPSDRVVRQTGGGWVSRASGEWIPSAWVLLGLARTHVRIAPRTAAPPPR